VPWGSAAAVMVCCLCNLAAPAVPGGGSLTYRYRYPPTRRSLMTSTRWWRFKLVRQQLPCCRRWVVPLALRMRVTIFWFARLVAAHN